jgi:choline transporter-like protein 2/4/5
VNAYIQCSITGKDFCSSAWNAFILLLTNAIRFGTAQSIGFIFVILGMAFIGVANAAGVYAVIHYVPQFKGLVTSWIGPVVVGGVIGLLMGQVFMSVYSFASDTILQCFMVDEELGRPDGQRPAELTGILDGIAEDANPKGGDE